ncbi:Sec-independent protein translocase protein TatB [Lysobacter sp. A03]|uniref:Sec-independent protein translocase protein TatB n=1 Tax=Lysobacter sp. A03 TaxID=1199154 RepID=UPI0005B6A447|nr:Sec-independent protein translocase protein TatB [Lysobacter sp. A03]KIQ96622.1 Twin-arginine translocation protein TatB [Lysobacter sp. A03]
MFDIGFSELFIVAIVALMVLGPERLPRAARFTGLWVRRARAQWYSVKSELERELADDELKRSLVRTRDELRDLGAELQNQGRELHDDLRREGQGIEKSVRHAEKSVKDAVAPVTRAATTAAAPALAQEPAEKDNGAIADEAVAQSASAEVEAPNQPAAEPVADAGPPDPRP